MENLFFDLRRLKYLGRNAIVNPTVRIRKPEEVIIGDNTIIDDFTYISTALETGPCCHIAPNVNMSGSGGRIVLGAFVGIGAGCTLHAASSDFVTASLYHPSVPAEFRFGAIVGDITVGSYSLIGAHCTVLPGASLPEGFAAAAQTVVRKRRFEPWTLYAGYTCKKIRRRETEEMKRQLSLKSTWPGPRPELLDEV